MQNDIFKADFTGYRYLDLGSYAEWDEDKRLEFLTRELEGKRPLVPPAMPMTDDVKEVSILAQLSYCVMVPDCCHAHVTQMLRQSAYAAWAY